MLCVFNVIIYVHVVAKEVLQLIYKRAWFFSLGFVFNFIRKRFSASLLWLALVTIGLI